MSNLKKNISLIILNGLININKLLKNIDFERTSNEYILSNIPNKVIKQYKDCNKKNDIEIFFLFLKKNNDVFKNFKIFILKKKNNVKISELFNNYFNINDDYNKKKIFDIYLRVVLVEKYLNLFNKQLPREHLKIKLEEYLMNNCEIEKEELQNCMLKNIKNIEPIPLNNLENNVEKFCKTEVSNINMCITKKK